MSEQRYTFEGKIGRGGIGAVYRAYDNQLGRSVAIKRMLSAEESDAVQPDTASDSLLKEAKVLSTLNHPNIVTVYDVGADSKGVFVVMELLDGETLDETVSRGVLTLEDFKEVVTQTLEAMIAAQDVDLVHRDLKPGNIMLVWLPSGKFQCKILDFGLAKFSEKPSVQTSDQGDAIMGSIFFMAPEQFERGQLDERTDMYSLGCIYYYCLTGKYPFQGETAAQVMASHLQSRMVPLERYRPDLPPWVRYWVKWLLQRELSYRPATAQEALEHFSRGTVGLPSLQQAINAETAKVSVVAEPVDASGLVRVVAAPRPAAPPVVARASGAAPGGGAATSTFTARKPVVVLPSAQKSSKGKWIGIGISSTLFLLIGGYLLFSRMLATKEENRFAKIIAEETPYGDSATVQWLLKYLDSKHDNNRRNAAITALSKMEGDGVDQEILNQINRFGGQEQKALVRCLTVRGYAEAVPAMIELASSSPSADVRKEALNGIAILGDNSHVEALLEILANQPEKANDKASEEVRDALVKAILSLVRMEENAENRTAPLLARLPAAGGQYRKALLAIAGALGGEPVLATFKEVLDGRDQEYKTEVLAALMNWPDETAAPLLQQLAEETDDKAVRLAAARAYIRLAGMPAPRTPQETEEMLDIAWSLADASKEKGLIMQILGAIPQDWAIDYVAKYLEEESIKNFAKRVQDTIRDRVAQVRPLVDGKPLPAKDAEFGGNYEVAYSEDKEYLTNWRDPGTWVSWNFIVEEPGTYQVSVSQANDKQPGSQYRVIVGDAVLEGAVKNTRDWKAFIDVDLGEIEIPEPGIYTLTMMPTGTAKKFLMNLRGVTLKKEK